MAGTDAAAVELSDTWGAFTGQAPEEIDGWGWTDALHPQDRERIREEWAARSQKLVPFVAEYRVRRHDGVYHRFSVRAVPAFDEEHFLGWVGTATDVEEQRRAEEDLVRHERLITGVAEALSHLLADDLDTAVGEAFRALGEATEVDRVYLFEIKGEGGGATVSQRYEWARDAVEPQIDNPHLQDLPVEEAGFGRWYEALHAGHPIVESVEALPYPERALLEEQDIVSL
ncbi:MAG: PAS domain-containing protein, partial [Rhodothermales bacterium]|nr:PAS domain-containing protein [Rhodothermales bacterium]